MKVGRMFINGKWKLSADGATRKILNPANNQVIAVVAEGTQKDAELAIQAARKAFDEGPWPQMRATERAAHLFKLADLIEADAEEFAKLDTLNNGKPLREARFDAADAAGCFRYYAGLITKPLGQNYEVSDATIEPMVVREPIGVCGQIIPWNYPLLMAAWKLAPGLAAGNCCILKPAETTPLSAIKLFELIEKAGFPPGSAQLVLGPGPTVGQTPRREHARGQDRLHRRHRHRPQDHAGRHLEHQKGHARTRWKKPEHRFRRRGSGCCAGVCHVRHLRGPGRSVQRGLASALGKKDRRQVPGAAGGGEQQDHRRRRHEAGDGDGAADHARRTWRRCWATSRRENARARS